MTKSRKSTDSDDETSVGTIAPIAGKLPTIRDIAIVNSANFDPKKVRLDDEKESGGITRVGLQYKYKDGEKTLYLSCPNNEEAFFRCNGVEEETYAKKGGQRTGTGKNVMKLYFDNGNPHHTTFHDALEALCAATKKKVEKEVGKKVDMRIRGLYAVKNDDGETVGHALAAKLIESGKGEVHTAAYNDKEQTDVKTIGRCLARPGLCFSYSIPEDEETYRINVSIGQVYYKARSIFPLRDAE